MKVKTQPTQCGAGEKRRRQVVVRDDTDDPICHTAMQSGRLFSCRILLLRLIYELRKGEGKILYAKKVVDLIVKFSKELRHSY